MNIYMNFSWSSFFRISQPWFVRFQIVLVFICIEQSCQLPDFSLRSQTFCHTADFSTTFLYMLKTKTFFAHPITKPPASTLEFKNFDFILRKNFVTLPSWLLRWLGRPMARGNAYPKHFTKFPHFFKTKFWQPRRRVSFQHDY